MGRSLKHTKEMLEANAECMRGMVENIKGLQKSLRALQELEKRMINSENDLLYWGAREQEVTEQWENLG